jgi:HEAT repeat protein
MNQKLCVCLFIFLSSAFAEEFVYEGRAAADWAKELRETNDPEKAMHALVKIGRDSVPALLPLLKDPNPKIASVASQVLMQMQQDKEAAPIFMPLLKDPNYEVRRTAVRVLGRFKDQPEVAHAIKEVLNDRDRAVAEAAEEVLRDDKMRPKMGPEEEAAHRQLLDSMIANAAESLKKNDLASAEIFLKNARTSPLAKNKENQERINYLERMTDQMRGGEKRRMDDEIAERDAMKQKIELQRRKQLELFITQTDMLIAKGDFDSAARVLNEAQKISPEDPRLIEFRNRMPKQTKQVKKVIVGEQDNLEDNPKMKKRIDEDVKKKNVGDVPADF